MNQEEEMLAVNNRRLERENKALREALLDRYAMAALTGLLMYYGDVDHIVDKDGRTSLHYAAFDHAEQMMKRRGQLHGEPEKPAKNETGGAA